MTNMASMTNMTMLEAVAQWDYTELEFHAVEDRNHFTESQLSAVFTQGELQLKVKGFYDGGGRFVIRFMPIHTGVWEYTTYSNLEALHNKTGAVRCVEARKNVRGMVGVDAQQQQHFAFSDGTPYYPFGTTAYVWNYQTPEVQAETLATLAKAPFNKIRMCVFPKHYDYNLREPQHAPFVGNIEDGFDLSRFDCAFFHDLERQILALQDLGIEVDLILFHPYDRWGFSKMSEAEDLRYVSYVTARLAAFRNIWWSLANEYDLLTEKSNTFWDKVFCRLQEEDPYGHLRSIHNWHCPPRHYRSNAHWYDHTKDWVTHASIQHHDMHFVPEWEDAFQKPIMIDECRYEGDMDLGWGNIGGEKMLDLFWQAVVAGGYATHGETYMHGDEIIWWAHGGRLIGASPTRIAFLREIIEDGPVKRLQPVITERHWDATIGKNADENYYLLYFGESCPKYRHMDMLPEGKKYRAEIIDAWNMTIDPVAGFIDAQSTIQLRSQKYLAIRLIAVK